MNNLLIDDVPEGASRRSQLRGRYSARRAAEFAVLTMVLMVLPQVFSGSAVGRMNLILVAVIGAVGLQLVIGRAGLLSIGSVALMAVGAFTAGGLWHYFDNPPFPLVLAASSLASGLVGIVVGLPSLRVRGLYLVVATLALHALVIYAVQRFQESNVGARGFVVGPASIWGIDLSGRISRYYTLMFFAIAVSVLSYNLVNSAVGRAWSSIRTMEIGAAGVGVDVSRLKLLAFVISSAIIGLQGALFAEGIGVVTTEMFPLELAIQYIAIVVIGGMGSIAGAWLGSIFVLWLPLVVQDILTQYLGSDSTVLAYELQAVLYGLAIVLFMRFEPGGLVQLWVRMRCLGGRTWSRLRRSPGVRVDAIQADMGDQLNRRIP